MLPMSRAFGFATIPKVMLKFVRLPALAGAGVMSAVAYVNYKIEEGTRYTKDLFAISTDWLAGTWGAAKGVVEQTIDVELPQFELPQWLQKVLRLKATETGYQRNQAPLLPKIPDKQGDPNLNNNNGEATVVAAAVAAAVVDQEEEDNKSKTLELARDEQMMVLTRKMIEIRNLLQQIEKSEALTLPSIVVIGAQSSGKSSVLESIVGQEFLPKGSNMVTRRPIELTLVNTPNIAAEYGQFPALGPAKITDFSQIQQTLTTLNKAVSEEDCVSDDPIQLNIYSRNVPDLTLIDLPGYIQVSTKDQPPTLKQKIAELCDKYIKEPNIILAVCAADVDLANSPALRASRKVDPRGLRTLGVITKMDLVSPERGVSLLKDTSYPLSLGYIGVICRAPPSQGLFNRKESIFTVIARNERSFFGSTPAYGPASGCKVGTPTLRKTLMQVLEKSMSRSLQKTSSAIRMELEEASYQFKVQYNDRNLTAETYIAETLDEFKHEFKQFSESFGKPQVRDLLKNTLDQKVMDILAERYWMDPKTVDWSKNPVEDVIWQQKLESAQSTLTRMGIGRLSTGLVISALATEMQRLANDGPLGAHPFAKDNIAQATDDIMSARYHGTSEQVENCIKPYKFDIDIDDAEWNKGRRKALSLLEAEIYMCRQSHKRLSESVGSRTLGKVVDYINTGNETKESMGYSQALLEKGRHARFLRDRETLLSLRFNLLKSKACGTPKGKYLCPEIFLDVVAQKLTNTAVLFINVELLSEFFYQVGSALLLLVMYADAIVPERDRQSADSSSL